MQVNTKLISIFVEHLVKFNFGDKKVSYIVGVKSVNGEKILDYNRAKESRLIKLSKEERKQVNEYMKNFKD